MYKFLRDCKDKNEPHAWLFSVGEPPSFKFYETENCKGMKNIKNTLKNSLKKSNMYSNEKELQNICIIINKNTDLSKDTKQLMIYMN